MKKKHELLKYAYDNFPKDTKFTWGGDDIISTGKFHFNDDTIVVGEDEIEYQVYDGKNWAIPVKESILSGKCAIAVSNEREFKLLMEHYESKGWRCVSEGRDYDVSFFSKEKVKEATYHDKFFFCCVGSVMESLADIKDPYKIIPFKDFAAEVGIEVPVFVMTSEDDVPIYVGDNYHMAKNITATGNKWELCVMNAKMDINSFAIVDPEHCKAFTTIGAAEKWIKEQNKPKVIGLVFQSEAPAEVSVTAKNIYVYPKKYMHCHFSGEELEQIYDAYTSLR